LDNPKKLATYGTQDDKNKTKTQHNMCWISIYANKYKDCKQDMNPPTNNRRYRTSITTQNSELKNT
jgi:hypothetical protein